MVKKIYNVVLMSTIGNGITTSGETFFYDWSQIPDKPYKLSFTFYSSITSMNQAVIPLILVDLGQTFNKIATSQNINNICYLSNFLGSLRFLGNSQNNIVSVDSISNPPSYLNGRPRSNNFIAQIIPNTGVFGEIGYPPNNYILTLYLEEI
jgi:hypothetical protein